MNYPTPYGNSDDLALENARLRELVKDLKMEKVSLRAWIDVLSEQVQKHAYWTTVFDCEIGHEEPYDFDYCVRHDRTFQEGGMCDHAGLSEVDYLTDKEMNQRGRVVIAEMKLDEIRRLAEIALEEVVSQVPADDIIKILGD